MWSIILVAPITAFVCFILAPSLYHFFWFTCHGIPGFDYYPRFLIWGAGGFENLTSPEFSGPTAGTLGKQSDYQQLVSFLAVYNYIEQLKRGETTILGLDAEVASTTTPGSGGTAAAAAASSSGSSINNPSSRQNLADKLASRLQQEKAQKLDLNRIVKGMRHRGMTDAAITQVVETLSSIRTQQKQGGENIPITSNGKMQMPMFTRRKEISENEIVDHIDNGLSLNGMGWQNLYDSSLIDDPVLQMLLQLTEDAPTRVCRTLISRRSWNSAKISCGIVIAYTIGLNIAYLLVECFVDPKSIWFGGWY